ncbi:MAG: hypothetical protein R3E26_03200 [Nitrosomonas sp.]
MPVTAEQTELTGDIAHHGGHIVAVWNELEAVGMSAVYGLHNR